ncbi:MAG: hypothetical protein ACODAC_04190 [Pseudomonadota bacterium]
MKIATVRGCVAGLAMALLSMSTVQAQEQHTTVRWGPIHLPAATSEGPGEAHNEIAGASGFSEFLLSLYSDVADYPVTKPCEDCYITGIKPNLVLPDGTTGNFNNGLMLHHVVNFNFSRPDITCRPNIFSGKSIKRLGGVVGGNERFFAAGNERTFGEMTPGNGYYVAEGDEWGLVYHLMNMAPEAQTVYFEYEFTWVDASAENRERIRPIWVDIDQCEDSEVEVPAGYSDVKWAWEADRSHTVLDMAGHVHNYGISIAWRNETTDDNVCTSVAGYSEGSPYAPVGPGLGTDDAHPESANVVTSDWLGLDNYNGNIADMTFCSQIDTDVDKGDQMMTHTQIHRPDTTDHDMGIMVGFLDEDYCITNFWCF